MPKRAPLGPVPKNLSPHYVDSFIRTPTHVQRKHRQNVSSSVPTAIARFDSNSAIRVRLFSTAFVEISPNSIVHHHKQDVNECVLLVQHMLYPRATLKECWMTCSIMLKDSSPEASAKETPVGMQIVPGDAVEFIGAPHFFGGTIQGNFNHDDLCIHILMAFEFENGCDAKRSCTIPWPFPASLGGRSPDYMELFVQVARVHCA